MIRRQPITLDTLDADGYDDDTAYFAGYDAVDAHERLRFAQADGEMS